MLMNIHLGLNQPTHSRPTYVLLLRPNRYHFPRGKIRGMTWGMISIPRTAMEQGQNSVCMWCTNEDGKTSLILGLTFVRDILPHCLDLLYLKYRPTSFQHLTLIHENRWLIQIQGFKTCNAFILCCLHFPSCFLFIFCTHFYLL